MASEGESAVSERHDRSSYEGPRISKPDMFMAIALWMERSLLAQSPSGYLPARGGQGTKVKKSGAVFVLPNDRALSIDCSRNGVHAAVSALNKFGQERAKGCQVYLARRPCTFCAKLLVQCEVAKVFYLPIIPEIDDPEDVRRVDTMFMTSSVGLSVKVPRIEESVVQDHDHRESPYRTDTSDSGAEVAFSEALVKEYWGDNWIARASEALSWSAFGDTHMKSQITSDMKSLMKWIAHTTVKDVPGDIVFVELHRDSYGPKKQNIPKQTDEGQNGCSEETSQPSPGQIEATRRSGDWKETGIPVPSDEEWQKHALHMSRLAQMLSQRSDDPTRRVGCVLMLRNEIAAIGWNGFPAKALYGEFPRTSDSEEARDKKEFYVIHAEQNALLTRNKRNMSDDSSILFINEVPCDECLPLLTQASVKNFVIPKLGPEIGRQQMVPGPRAFKLAFDKGKFECFGSKRSAVCRNLNM